MKRFSRKDGRSGRFLTLPNLLTLLRLLLIPPILLALLYRSFKVAFALYALAATTDWVDGYLARRIRQTSRLGLILDPIADKLLSFVSLVALTVPSLGYSNPLPLWFTVLILFRDIFLLVGIIILYSMIRRISIKVHALGKASTFFEDVSLFLVFLLTALNRPAPLLFVLYIITLALALLSLEGYVRYALKEARHRAKNKHVQRP